MVIYDRIELVIKMKKSIRDYDLKGKRVIIRVDFNVPISDGEITDDNRIRESLDTINYALDNGAKVILLSHLGRVKSIDDKDKYSLEVVAYRLSELLEREVIFVDETRGELLEREVNNLGDGCVLLVQNTRYEDLDGKKESNCDLDLGKYWASLGDIFINDAFGTMHRAHASNVGISKYLPSGIGFLVEKELKYLSDLDNCERPFSVILGGAKVSDKIGVISSLVKKCDYVLIGGGMAYTFLYALGYNIGKSLLDISSVDFCKKLLSEYKDKIILPVDSINGKDISNNFVRYSKIDDILDDEMGLDIGDETVKLFCKYLDRSRTVIWNGPVGYSEIAEFSNGTKSLLGALKKNGGRVIIGGGDTAASAIRFGYRDAFSHISTGGGACLELLEGKKLPGLECIDDK